MDYPTPKFVKFGQFPEDPGVSESVLVNVAEIAAIRPHYHYLRPEGISQIVLSCGEKLCVEESVEEVGRLVAKAGGE